jgi:(R,R)-butanediol dehydrogenase/meso-butanediol dehydrogenase/diacetyl reductase
MAHAVPATLDARDAAVVEPLAVGLHAVRRGALEAGTTAAVFGLGPIGIAVALGLRATGVDAIVSDPSAARREAARALGFRHVLDPAADDVVAALRDLTGGRGVDGAFDAAGVPATLDAAFDGVAVRGVVVLVAVPLQPVEIAVPRLRRVEAQLTASGGGVAQDFEDVIGFLASGAYDLGPWTTTIAFDDLLDGFDALRRQERVKVLVDIGSS